MLSQKLKSYGTCDKGFTLIEILIVIGIMRPHLVGRRVIQVAGVVGAAGPVLAFGMEHVKFCVLQEVFLQIGVRIADVVVEGRRFRNGNVGE